MHKILLNELDYGSSSFLLNLEDAIDHRRNNNLYNSKKSFEKAIENMDISDGIHHMLIAAEYCEAGLKFNEGMSMLKGEKRFYQSKWDFSKDSNPVSHLEEAIRLMPDHIFPKIVLSAFIGYEDNVEALENYKKYAKLYIESNKDNPNYVLNLIGYSCFAYSSIYKVHENLKTIINYFPEDTFASYPDCDAAWAPLFNLGFEDLRNGNFGRAEMIFKSIQGRNQWVIEEGTEENKEKKADKVGAILGEAFVHVLKEEFYRAYKIIDEFEEYSSKDNPTPHTLKAIINAKMENYDEAMDLLNKSKELEQELTYFSKNDPYLLPLAYQNILPYKNYWVAFLLNKKGDNERAYEILKKTFDDHPITANHDAKMNNLMGRLYFLKGEFESSKYHLERGLKFYLEKNHKLY